jgi:DNA polymerase mu
MPADRTAHHNHAHPYARPATPAESAHVTRPPPVPHPTVHSSDASVNGSKHDTIQQEAPLYPLLSRIRIHILPTKLDGELPKMYACVEQLGGIISPVDDAEIIVTALRGRPRLIKVLGSSALIDSGWIVSLSWIKSAYDAAVTYRDTLAKEGLTGDEEEDHASKPSSGVPPVQRPYVPPPTVPSREEFAIPGTGADVRGLKPEVPVISDAQDEEEENPADLKPFPMDIDLRDIANRAVQRCSPLICVNQDIVSLDRSEIPMRG